MTKIKTKKLQEIFTLGEDIIIAHVFISLKTIINYIVKQ